MYFVWNAVLQVFKISWKYLKNWKVLCKYYLFPTFFFLEKSDLAVLGLYSHLVLVRTCVVTTAFIHTDTHTHKHTRRHTFMHIGASVPQPLPFPVVPLGTLLYTPMFVLASVGIQVVTLPYMTMVKCLLDFYSFGMSWFCQENWKRGGNNVNQITWKVFRSLMHKLTDLCKAQLKWQDKTVRK